MAAELEPLHSKGVRTHREWATTIVVIAAVMGHPTIALAQADVWVGTWEYRQANVARPSGVDAEGERLVIRRRPDARLVVEYLGLERTGDHGLFYTAVDGVDVRIDADGTLRFTVPRRPLFAVRPRSVAHARTLGTAGVTSDVLTMRARRADDRLVVSCTGSADTCPDRVMAFDRAQAALIQPPDEHARTREYNRALGVECEHCHVQGDPANTSKPTFDFARRMTQMVRGINEGPLRATRGLSCWSCHRGRPVPDRLPASRWEPIETANAATFASAPDGLSVTMSVYAASLGVSCTHCHVAGAWQDTTKRPHQQVSTMLSIFEAIPRYFDPAVRAPRTQCYMCHHGATTVERQPR